MAGLRARALSRLEGLRHPEAGHDRGERPYFEGWYVKLVSADRSARLAVIPGLFRSQDGQDEAFVQILDGANGMSWYVPYPATDYWAARDRFTVQVGPNRFTPGGVQLDIPAGADHVSLNGTVQFSSDLDPWPVTARSPGAMGWYAYMPFMECYHGVDSFRHDLVGSLVLDGTALNFDSGRGYLEQDWGQAFPVGYVWLHSNHFTDADASLMASVALIPWLRGSFRGLLIGLRTSEGLHRFATYTGAKSMMLEIDDTHVRMDVRSRQGHVLRLRAERQTGALLHAPVRTQMHRRVEETLGGSISVQLRDRSGRVLFDDVGHVAGMEVHGDITALLSTAER